MGGWKEAAKGKSQRQMIHHSGAENPRVTSPPHGSCSKHTRVPGGTSIWLADVGLAGWPESSIGAVACKGLLLQPTTVCVLCPNNQTCNATLIHVHLGEWQFD
jgi:hypothetical protein